MNKFILNTDIQFFIDNNLNEEPTYLILKGASFPQVQIQEIVGQIISKKKCKKKLPTWFNTSLIYYPNRINIEQTSSEITANYKAALVTGNILIDISGGFGVDCYYYAKKIKNVIHCEIISDLSEIVHYNYKILQVENVKTVAEDGLDYLRKSAQKYDWIYADPSRRNKTKGKVFLLDDCSPDIPINLDLLFTFSNNLLLKISPLLDISHTAKTMINTKEIHVVAVDNEVKELLFILEKNYFGEINIKTINIKKNEIETFESSFKKEVNASYSLPAAYLYEPNSAILKAGLFTEISTQLLVSKLHMNSHLYTSSELIDFPGRRFKIINTTRFDRKKLMELIPSQKANITTRNFPLSVAQIRKKTRIKEGGNVYLFFTTDIRNKHIVLVCEKV